MGSHLSRSARPWLGKLMFGFFIIFVVLTGAFAISGPVGCIALLILIVMGIIGGN